MKKTPMILLAVVALLALTSVAVFSASPARTVKTLGDEVLKPNVMISSNLRFEPGPLTIRSGDTVTWVHSDDTEAPHTVTLANENELVRTFADFLGACPPCTAAINAALAGHFPPNQPPVPVLDPDGDGLFDSPGDSLLFFPGESVSAAVAAPSGSTVYYFCAIHPWMQGTIDVR
jgi:plastocyanin